MHGHVAEPGIQGLIRKDMHNDQPAVHCEGEPLAPHVGRVHDRTANHQGDVMDSALDEEACYQEILPTTNGLSHVAEQKERWKEFERDCSFSECPGHAFIETVLLQFTGMFDILCIWPRLHWPRGTSRKRRI